MINSTLLLAEIINSTLNNSSPMNNSPKNNTSLSKADEILAIMLLIIIILILGFCCNSLGLGIEKKYNANFDKWSKNKIKNYTNGSYV